MAATELRERPTRHRAVHFFARPGDRNQPADERASGGGDTGHSFIQIFSEPSDPQGSTLLILDEGGDPMIVEPGTGRDGDLQLDDSSCD